VEFPIESAKTSYSNLVIEMEAQAVPLPIVDSQSLQSTGAAATLIPPPQRQLSGSSSTGIGEASGSSSSSAPADRKYLWSEELNNFVVAIDAYQHTIPESVVQYYLQKGGFNVIDPITVRMIGIAADKFLAGTDVLLHEVQLFNACWSNQKLFTMPPNSVNSANRIRNRDPRKGN
jgi:hypothetical protein